MKTMPCVLQLETNDNFGSFPGTQSTVAESNATFWTLSRPSTAFLWLSSLLSGSETHADATCSEKSVERLLTPEEWARKQTAIERCLRGGGGSGVNESNVDSANDGDDDADAIDLWHLRELALAPGGLLDPSLRKRAWPILTAALPHSHVVAGGGAVTQPSSADLIRLHRDVKHTVWNVQEHFVTQQRKLSMEAAAQIKKKRRVSFAPELTDKDEDEKKQEDEAESEVAMVLSLQGGSPTSTATTEEDDSPTATGPTTGTGAESPFSLDGITEGSVGTSDTPSTTASHLWSQHHASQGSSSYGRRVKWRKANKKEQTIVGNVVTSCLRTAAPESQAFEDDRFHYYTGLHDLTALIMINLESPSLSSLVLSKLAVYHLRDAMRKERAVLETALQLTLFPLLKQVDPVLYDHIVVQAGLTLPTFALTWISNWFATDVTDITAASRLLDVFVVSHPTTPLYLAVGMLTCHRQRILQCKPILHAVYTAVRTLPLLTILNDDAAAIADDNGTVTSAAANAHHTVMANVEHVISTALDYMKRIPPFKLVDLSSKSTNEQTKRDQQHVLAPLPAIAMLSSSPPSWCIADTSPNEWKLLLLQRLGRGMDHDASTSSPQCKNYEQYPLAMAASGRELSIPPSKVRSPFRKMFFLLAALVGLVVVTAAAMLAAHAFQPPCPQQNNREKIAKATMTATPNVVYNRPKPGRVVEFPSIAGKISPDQRTKKEKNRPWPVITATLSDVIPLELVVPNDPLESDQPPVFVSNDPLESVQFSKDAAHAVRVTLSKIGRGISSIDRPRLSLLSRIIIGRPKLAAHVVLEAGPEIGRGIVGTNLHRFSMLCKVIIERPKLVAHVALGALTEIGRDIVSFNLHGLSVWWKVMVKRPAGAVVSVAERGASGMSQGVACAAQEAVGRIRVATTKHRGLFVREVIFNTVGEGHAASHEIAERIRATTNKLPGLPVRKFVSNTVGQLHAARIGAELLAAVVEIGRDAFTATIDPFPDYYKGNKVLLLPRWI